ADQTPTSASVQLKKGVVYHVAMTYAHGRHILYVNGVPTTMTPALNEDVFTASLYGLYLGDANGAVNASSRDLFTWGGYELSSAEVGSIRDGADATTIGTGAAFRIGYSLATPGRNPGDTVVLGDSGLYDCSGLGQTGLRFSNLAVGSGTAT